MSIRGYVLIETEVGSARAVGEEMQRLKHEDASVVAVDTVTGPFDVIVHLEAVDLDKLGNCITDGIQANPRGQANDDLPRAVRLGG